MPGAGRGEPPNFAFKPVRTRLIAGLVGAASAWPNVLSIVAPIGYGKTVLMSELFAHWQQAGVPCFWIGLDERDADLERVLAALESVAGIAAAGLAPPEALLADRAPIESRINSLEQALAALPERSTIFIDNLNSCVDPELGRLLDALIFRSEAAVRFIWSSSTKLPFNFARAKLQGLIRQVGLAELSLNDAEVGELLGADLGGRIGVLGIQALLQQTEGWPAAIRLAQIILADADQPLRVIEDFSGSDEDIAALLNRQVLAGFSTELRAFVLALAPLRCFSVDLARCATGVPDSEQHIEYLLRRNVFIIPLDRQRKRYRLHGLFRSYLCGEAEKVQDPWHRREVLRRAAVWSEAFGDWRDAVDYALSADDGPMASRLVEQNATNAVRDQGDIAQYIRWVERLRVQGVGLEWETQFWFVWALIFSHRYDYGQRQLELLVDRVGRAAADQPIPNDLERRIAHIRVCIDLFTDRLGETRRGAEQWLTSLQSDNAFSVGSMHCINAVCQATSFSFSSARQTMCIAESIKLQIGATYGIAWASLLNALIAIYQGDYGRAHTALSAGLAQARLALGDDSGVVGTMALVGMKCAVEMGLNDLAHELMDLGMRTAGSHGLVDTAACGFDAALKLWHGKDDEPVSIPRLRDLARAYPPRLSLMLSCYLVRRLLHLGQLQEAIAEARVLGLGAEGVARAAPDLAALAVPCFRDLLAATAIDFNIATGQIKAAEAAIGKELNLARREGRAARQVELMLAKAKIAIFMDQPSAAVKELILAVSVGARSRIVRPFIDHASMVAAIVSFRPPASWSFPAVEEQAFFNAIRSASHIAQSDPHEQMPMWIAEAGQSSSPTKREVELLTLIEMGMSNQDLADCFQISMATIKWHLQNLYRKLGVANRTGAVARARTLNLLSR